MQKEPLEDGIKPMKHVDLSAAKSERVGVLFDLDTRDARRLWRAEELTAVMEHQLSVPIRVDLVEFDRGLAAKVERLADAQGLLLKSFSDLLRHPHPPVELLAVVKDFAKACRYSPDSQLPPAVASMLYYASIAAAMLHCQRQISKLTNSQLHEGFVWALAQPWLGGFLRDLLREAMTAIAPDCTQRSRQRHEASPAAADGKRPMDGRVRDAEGEME